MSLSLTSWNFGDRARNGDFQYILHCVSLGEKDEVLESVWKQHTDEMEVWEGNVFHVCGKQCTLQFQPNADMSWHSWANNELNQGDTFPSPANRELKQPRRRRQQKPHKFAYLTMKNSIFARFARAYFNFWHFVDVLVLSTTWNDQFCSCVDDVSIWWQIFNFVFLCPTRWFQI